MLQTNNKSKKTALILGVIVIGMFGFGFALVPFYNVMCKVIGINGKTGGAAAAGNYIDESRTVTVQFIANNSANLPWKFYPLTQKLQLHPGENKKVAYFAENDGNKIMTVQAIPSVSPGRAAKYLKKTECFCFTQQTLNAHSSMEMPLLFHLDTELPKNIKIVTLAYTLFDVTNTKKKINKQAGKIS